MVSNVILFKKEKNNVYEVEESKSDHNTAGGGNFTDFCTQNYGKNKK